MSSFKTVISMLNTPGKMILPLASGGFFNWLPDKPYLQLAYWGQMGKNIDLDNPQTFNEKLQWLKLYDRNPRYHSLVDKYELKQYIAEKIGSEYTIQTLGLWNNVDEIPFDQLPNEFVLKCTHDSGSIIICQNKKDFDINAAKKKLTHHMKKSTYWLGREWPYKGITARIIAEPYLKDTRVHKQENQIKGLSDYKVHCFDGRPKVILVCKERFSEEGVTEDFFDVQWNRLSVKRPDTGNSKENIPCPEKLEEMLSISKVLSKGIPFVRVDFYLVNQQLYVGELTFFPASGLKGFLPASFDEEMGTWLILPESIVSTQT